MFASTLEIRLLGGFEVRLGDKKLVFHTQKTRGLLGYLALHPGRSHNRIQLAGLLWPESTDQRAAQSLRQSLSFLRRMFDPVSLEVTRQTVAFAPGSQVWIDAVQLRGKIASLNTPSILTRDLAISLSEAASLYSGDLLAGFFLNDAPEFETWLVAERENLRAFALAALERLGEYHIQRGEYRMAQEHLMRAIALDPWHEAAFRGLMRALALSGNLAGALAQYEKGRLALLEGLGVEPALDTQTLHAQIRAGLQTGSSATPPPAPRPEPPFIGRGEEHAHLATALSLMPHRVSATHIPTFILLEGEAGTGKTRLAEEFSRYAVSQGAQLAGGRAYELSARLPYQPFIEILRDLLSKEKTASTGDDASVSAWLPELARLLPELRAKYTPPLSSGPEARQHLFEAVLNTLIQSASPQTPLLLFLDDLHWADEATVDLLHFLVRRGTGFPLLFLGAYRPEETPAEHPLTQLRRGLSRDHLVETLPLQPLTSEDIHAIAASLFPSSNNDFARFLSEQSEGNPFVLTETLYALFDRGEIWRDELGDGWLYDRQLMTKDLHAPEAISTTSLEDTILRRVDRLPRETRVPLTFAAVIGRSFDSRLLEELIFRQAPAHSGADACLSVWLDHRLVRSPQPGFYDFTHDKIRETIYLQLSDKDRCILHGETAAALEHLHSSETETLAPTLAHHYCSSLEPRRALPYLRTAAVQAAEALAFVHVTRYCTQALEISTALPLQGLRSAGLASHDLDMRFEFLDMRQRAYQHLGQTAEEGVDAETMHAIAEERGNPQQLAIANERLALFHARCGEISKARSAGWEAVAAAKQAGESTLQVKSLVPLAMLIREMPGGMEQALELLKDAHEQANRMDDISEQAYVLGHLAVLLEESGDLEGALRQFRQSETLLRRARDYTRLASCLYSLAGTCRLLGMFAEGKTALTEALQLTDELDLRGVRLPVMLGLGRLAIAQEQAEEAREAFEQALSMAVQFQRPLLEGQAHWGLGHVARLTGDLQEARERFECALTCFSSSEITLLALARADLSLLYLESGNLDDALNISRQGVAAIESGNTNFAERQKVYWAHYRVLLVAGQYTEATQWLAKAREVILQQASKLVDPQRAIFLEHILLHRKILRGT